jgi:hypothetical protein
MFSVISGGQEPPVPSVTVQDLFALDEVTSFNVVDRTSYRRDITHFEVVRISQGRWTSISASASSQESRVRVPDEALDTVIRALEQARVVRDRKARPVGLAEPLVEDEPSDDAGPSVARGHGAVETLRGTPTGNAIADALDRFNGTRSDDGPVAA